MARTILSIEMGATSCVALLANASGKILQRRRLDFSRDSDSPQENVKRMLKKVVTGIRAPRNTLHRIVLCLAGISFWKSSATLRTELKEILRQEGIHTQIEVYPDWTATLASALGPKPGIVLISGTGSCAIACDGKGNARRCGGGGKLLGDEGSGYAIGLSGLRAIMEMEDQRRLQTPLYGVLVKKIRLRSAQELIAWSNKASKREIAALAPAIFSAAKRGDTVAMRIMDEAAEDLLDLIGPLGDWLATLGISSPYLALAGGVFENQTGFTKDFLARVQGRFGLLDAHVCRNSKALGALYIALGKVKPPVVIRRKLTVVPARSPLSRGGIQKSGLLTESANPVSRAIDTLDALQIVDIIQKEDSTIPSVLLGQRDRLAKAADWMAQTLANGGRVFYVGAGTSGRLAALDAAEWQPTFGVPASWVVVILAGGATTLTRAAEGAEDDTEGARRQLIESNFSSKDILIGIAASGSTPFVLAAMQKAKEIGARSIGISCNPHMPLEKLSDLAIVASVGPEVVAGSTRMKAGTATKMILNTLSTTAMIRLGKVYDHWMVDVTPTNKKLRLRALAIIQGVTGCGPARAKELLKQARGNTKAAIVMGKQNISLEHAKKCLALAQGKLRAVLDADKPAYGMPS